MASSACLRAACGARNGRSRSTTCRYAIVLGLASCAPMPATASGAGDPLRDVQWNLDVVNADAAHGVSIGSGTTVAVLDSGVEASHPDLAGRVVAGGDFIDGDQSPDDEHGHGTNVAGIIVAGDRNGIGIKGAAPGTTVLAIRVLDGHNRGHSTALVAGINAAVAAGADVINLALNPAPTLVAPMVAGDPLAQAIESAARAGVVVASAGNEGVPLCNWPILTTKILCVGAINRARSRSSYSNYAVRVDIVAPAASVDLGRPSPLRSLAGDTALWPAHPKRRRTLPRPLRCWSGWVCAAAPSSSASSRPRRPLPNALRLGHGLLNMGAAVAGVGPAVDSSAQGCGGTLSARAPRRVRFSTMRRRGLRIVCTSPKPGTAACASRAAAVFSHVEQLKLRPGSRASCRRH